MCGLCVRGVFLKDRVLGGDWLLRIRCTCGVSVCVGVGVREGVRVCCVVWVVRGALFGVGVEVSEGHCVCEGLLGGCYPALLSGG